LKICAGAGKDVTLPFVGCYGTDRARDSRAERWEGGARINGYRGALSFAATSFVESLAQLVFNGNAKTAEAELDQVSSALAPSLESLAEESPDSAELVFKSLELKSMLCGGAKCSIGLIMDIAKRMLELNPQLGNAAIHETPGVALIDDIGWQLGPKWHARILPILQHLFPKVQFVAVTHSPAVIRSVKNESLMVLDEGKDKKF
jgi:hypothetical protein